MQVHQLKYLISNLEDSDVIDFIFIDDCEGVELTLSSITQPEDSHVAQAIFIER